MHYLYRHIRLDKNEPFYIGIGTKKENTKFNSIKSEYSRAIKEDKVAYKYRWKEVEK